MSLPKAVAFFKDAIESGEEELKQINEDEGFSEEYLVFMQQLSNRYFNRALFLLTVRSDHPDPYAAERQGITDLTISMDMDRELIEKGESGGFKRSVQVYLELLLGRMRGILMLMRLMEEEDEWEIEDLFDDAREALESAANSSDCDDVFRDMSPFSYMQRLDMTMMEHQLLLASRSQGEEDHRFWVQEAASLAIQMFHETDMVIKDAAVVALTALIRLSGISPYTDFGGADPQYVHSTLVGYRQDIMDQSNVQTINETNLESTAAANIGDISMETF